MSSHSSFLGIQRRLGGFLHLYLTVLGRKKKKQGWKRVQILPGKTQNSSPNFFVFLYLTSDLARSSWSSCVVFPHPSSSIEEVRPLTTSLPDSIREGCERGGSYPLSLPFLSSKTVQARRGQSVLQKGRFLLPGRSSEEMANSSAFWFTNSQKKTIGSSSRGSNDYSKQGDSLTALPSSKFNPNSIASPLIRKTQVTDKQNSESPRGLLPWEKKVCIHAWWAALASSLPPPPPSLFPLSIN